MLKNLSYLVLTALLGCTNVQGNDSLDAAVSNNLLVKKEQTIIKEKGWEKLDDGLFLAEFATKKESLYGDSKITVLKIDSEKYNIKLMSASEHDYKLRTAEKWAEEFDLVATINAGMFEQDYLTATGYMKNYQHVNNPKQKKGFNTIFAFNPKKKGIPLAQIIDTRCQNFSKLKDKYNSLIQSIRMINCHQKNTWSQQPKMWSIAALGIDKEGNILFIHSRSPYTVHDFIDNLLSLPININNAMYLEGGPEASLYFNLPNKKIERIGSYETGFRENNDNNEFWPIPNIIGIKKK